MTKTGTEYTTSAEKRRFDLLAGSAIAVAVAPLALGVAAASMVDTHSFNPLFNQKRVGHGGEMFNVPKFRTIRSDRTEGSVKTYGTFDPRATRLGLLLRKSGLDEVPQLLEVFNGSMSVVGPRPEIPSMLDQYQDAGPGIFEDWFTMYTDGKPGLTSLSSLYRHAQPRIEAEHLRTSMLMDLRYAGMASAQLDRIIVERTPLSLARAALHVGDMVAANAITQPPGQLQPTPALR